MAGGQLKTEWEIIMIRPLYCLAVACLLSVPVFAQQTTFSDSNSGPDTNAGGTVAKRGAVVEPPGAFSRLAFSGGVSMMGINLQAATNVNRYSNLRVSGNVFSYTVNDITTNGFTANGKLDLATMGASFDFYPWPNHGFRLSPGALFYNQNSLTANATVSAGQSFTLNHVDYYSSTSDPIRATAKVGLNATNPSFTMTTGWGNLISRRGGHWSFPFELGAAFVSSPSFTMNLAGTACDATGEFCANAATDPIIQSNLQAQIAKYKKDVQPLSVYPILSFGVGYNFNIGGNK
jgi:hypothetical protein